ncbi:hypothetical protein KRP22_007581 [Phytophthora ramorum]|nr:hypothetical protein KRP22_4407 [Phytophthora ramorum]
MKASYSILAAVALLAVAAPGTPGAHAGQNPVTRHTHMNNHSYSFQSIPDSKSHRALRSMDTPKQGPIHNGKQKHPHHDDPQQNDKRAHRALLGADGLVSIQRTLGQAPVTPATTTTSSSKVTPAPTKPKVTPAATTTKATPAPTTAHNKPKLTPAPTKTKPKATPASTTTSSTSKHTPAQIPTKPKVTPVATKATPVPSTTKPKTPTPKTVKPKTTPAATTSKDKTPVPTKASSSKVTPSPTTSKSTTTGNISDVVQQKTRSLGEDQTEQQQQQRSHDYKQGVKSKSKNGGKHHKQM